MLYQYKSSRDSDGKAAGREAEAAEAARTSAQAIAKERQVAEEAANKLLRVCVQCPHPELYRCRHNLGTQTQATRV